MNIRELLDGDHSLYFLITSSINYVYMYAHNAINMS
jgi:hypothetical protein